MKRVNNIIISYVWDDEKETNESLKEKERRIKQKLVEIGMECSCQSFVVSSGTKEEIHILSDV